MIKFDHYWICVECANKMGGVFPEGHICTVVIDAKCEYCGLNKTIVIPWVDYNWPEDLDTNRIAKISRD